MTSELALDPAKANSQASTAIRAAERAAGIPELPTGNQGQASLPEIKT